MTALHPADLTVVVSAIAATSELRVTLASLSQQTVSGFAIAVLVHGDNDLADAGIAEGVDVIRVDTHDLPRAHDVAVQAAKTPLVLVLSSGLEASPGLIEAHLAAHNHSPADDVAAHGPVEWHRTVADTALNRWLARARDRGLDGAPLATNLSFKTARYLAVEPGADGELGGDEASVVVRLRTAGVQLQAVPAASALDTRRFGWTDVERHYQTVARTEVQIAAHDATFDAPTRRKTLAVSDRRPVSPLWARVADRVPRPLRPLTDARAADWYHQRIVDVFLDSWEGRRDFAELREYLGDRYDPESFVRHTAVLEDEEEASGDEASFYRTSETYLYDLTVFAMSGTKAPYRRVIRSLVPPGARLLDYGCGIGSDGLRLLDEGYDVEFADFDNPSTRFLRWRLARRGIDARVHDIDVEVPRGFDLAYCFDVIEHIEDPHGFLDVLESTADIVVVNFLEPTPDDIHLHKPLDVEALVSRATKHGLLWYRRYHGRSHLVAYRTGRGRGVNPALSALRRWVGVHRAPRACEPASRKTAKL